MAKSPRKISEDLKNTILTHPNIKDVHFSVDGKHHFNVYAHGTELYARIHKDNVIDKKSNAVIEVKTPVRSTLIVESISRAEIVGSE